MRVLLTGGSGFIAAHCLDDLLAHGHSVVTTVRSQAKADKIAQAHPNAGKNLTFVIVEDIAQPNAFDNAVVSDPPFEAIIHTASPFHFNVTDVQKELLDPAVIGTTSILSATKKYAPTVKRIVITSSFAAIVNAKNAPDYTYSEKDWNPVTHEEALQNPATGYRASKTYAERAAWDFIEKEKPNFDLVTMNPPLVIGPIVHYLNDLNSLNTSNQRTRDCLQGKWKDEIPDTGVVLWVDVRDLAQAHVKAIEIPEAGNNRFFIIQGTFSNKEIAGIVKKHFPEYKDVPGADVKGGELPANHPRYDNSKSKKVLGMDYKPLEPAIVELVKSLKNVGA